MRRKLKQELIGSIEMQVFRGVDAQLDKLSVIDLKAHLKREAVCIIPQQLKGIPHLVVVKKGVSAVRGANNSGYASLLGSRKHRQALIEIDSTVVYTRQDMTMNVAHRSALIN